MAPRPDALTDQRDPRRILANQLDDNNSVDDSSSSSSSFLRAADTVAQAKADRFAQGVQKKSRHEKEQELAKKKAEQSEAEAAKAYADFVAAFGEEGQDDQGDEEGSGGRTGRYARTTTGKGFVRAGGSESYNPLRDRPQPVPAAPKVVAPPTAPRAMRPTAVAMMNGDDDDDEVRRTIVTSRWASAAETKNLLSFSDQRQTERTAREEEARHGQFLGTAQEVTLGFLARRGGPDCRRRRRRSPRDTFELNLDRCCCRFRREQKEREDRLKQQAGRSESVVESGETGESRCR